MAKPTLPDLPVIFYHKASLKPVVKTSTSKKSSTSNVSQKSNTVYYLPALSSPITYQAYQSAYANSPTKTIGTQSSIKTSNPDKVDSQTKPKQSTSKKNETSSSQKGQKTKNNKILFSQNTGLDDKDEKAFHQFTKDLEKKGKEKYAWAKFIPGLYQNLVDSYVFQGIAQGGSYQTARTQIPFVTFSSLPKSDNSTNVLESLQYQHKYLSDYPDLAHSGATLATSGITGVFSTLTKPFLGIVPSSSNILKGLSIANSQSNARMLNSFYGDLITTMGTDDILANIDSIILSQHPDYRHLSAHERLKKYYSQTDLDQKRQELFLESYSKDKSTAKLKFVAALAFSSVTLGGILAMGYSIVTGQTNGSLLKDNLNKLDDIVLGGSLKQFIKSPVSSTVNYAKNIGGKVVTKVKTGWNSLTKKVSNFFGGKVNKKATKTKSSSKSKTKAKTSGLLSKASKVLKKTLKQAEKLVLTVNKKLKENKTLNKISSTLSNLGKSKTTSKKKTGSKKKATPKKKSAPKKKATPKKKVAPKKKVTSKKKKRR